MEDWGILFKKTKLDDGTDVGVCQFLTPDGKCRKRIRWNSLQTQGFISHYSTHDCGPHACWALARTPRGGSVISLDGNLKAMQKGRDILNANHQRLLLEFLVETQSPFSIVNYGSFQALAKGWNPAAAAELKDRTWYSRTEVPKAVADMYDSIVKSLNQAVGVGLTCDIWTDLMRRPFLGVTAQWYESGSQELLSACLFLGQVRDHSAVATAEILNAQISQFKLAAKAVAMLTDNAVSAVAAIGLVGSLPHFRCLAHTLQLGVQQLLQYLQLDDQFAKCFEQAKQLLTWWRTNHHKYRIEQSPPVKPPGEVVTRWSSTFSCYGWLLLPETVTATQNVRRAPATYMDPPPSEDPPEIDNPELLLVLFTALKPIATITTKIQADRHPTYGLGWREVLRFMSDYLPEMLEYYSSDCDPTYVSDNPSATPVNDRDEHEGLGAGDVTDKKTDFQDGTEKPRMRKRGRPSLASMSPAQLLNHVRLVEERRQKRLERPAGDVMELPEPGSKRASSMRDATTLAALAVVEADDDLAQPPALNPEATGDPVNDMDDASEPSRDVMFSVDPADSEVGDRVVNLTRKAIRRAAFKVFEHAGSDLLALHPRGVLSLILDPHVTSVEDGALVPPYFLRKHRDRKVAEHFLHVWEEGVKLLVEEVRQLVPPTPIHQTRSSVPSSSVKVSAPLREKSRLLQTEDALQQLLTGSTEVSTPEPESTSAIEQPPQHPADVELTHYIKMLSDKGNRPLDNQGILSWWSKHGTDMPLLAGMARKFLCIPATSAASERVFSVAGQTNQPRRARLTPHKMASLSQLKSNAGWWMTWMQDGK